MEDYKALLENLEQFRNRSHVAEYAINQLRKEAQ